MSSIFKQLQKFLYNPLFTLRVILSLLICKNSLEQLNFLMGIKNNEPYALSYTWITNILPKQWLVNGDNFEVYYYLIIVSTALAVIGLLGRLGLFLLASSCIIVNGMVEGIGAFDHTLSLPSQMLLLLAFLPGTMAFSIDRLIFSSIFGKTYFKLPKRKLIKQSTNLILLLLVVTYFTAGVSKIRYGGAQWLDGSTLGFYIQDHTFDYEEGKKQILLGRSHGSQDDFEWKGKYNLYAHTYGNYNGSPRMRAVNSWLGSHKYVMSLISILTVLLELSGFIVFINPRLRNLYLVSIIGMHSLIGLTMGLGFTFYRIICVLLIDWKIVFHDIKVTRRRMALKRLKVAHRLAG